MAKKPTPPGDEPNGEGTLDDLLADATPAPAGAGGGAKAKKFGTKKLIQVSAPLLVRSFLAAKPISAHEVWQGVPELQTAYKSANALGTSLSQGVGGNGLKLWCGEGGYVACRQNAALAIRALSPASRDELLKEMSLADIKAAMEKLPAATAPAVA